MALSKFDFKLGESSEKEGETVELPPRVIEIQPNPQFCIKCKVIETGEKVFLNICIHDDVPQPINYSDKELMELLEKDPLSLKLPMSIGDPHAEVDKQGNPCRAHEIVCNPMVLEKCKGSDTWSAFFMIAVLQAVSAKYEAALDSKDYVTLKNKKYFGTIQPTQILTQRKVVKLSETPAEENGSGDSFEEKWHEFRKTRVSYEIYGELTFLVVDVVLPIVKDVKELDVSVGYNKISVIHDLGKRKLSLTHPFIRNKTVPPVCEIGRRFNDKNDRENFLSLKILIVDTFKLLS